VPDNRKVSLHDMGRKMVARGRLELPTPAL
jgi:hypothetical protein